MNTTHPLLPDYTGPTSGWFTFLHHDLPIEYSHNVLERRDYVLSQKPQAEHRVRALACQVLPVERVPKALDAAWRVIATSRRSCATAWTVYDTACRALSTAYLEEVLPDTNWRALYSDATRALIYDTEPLEPAKEAL